MQDHNAILELNNVSRTYGEGPSAVHALLPMDLTVERGRFVTIVGASGSGKSTLLNLLGLLDAPSSGTLRLEGADVTALSERARTLLRRDRIGFVFQFFNLLPTMTATENVALPARLAGRPYRESRERAVALLGRVGLARRLDHRPDQLSGGEMQRVAIARALMLDPPVLLADEPTGNLDSRSSESIIGLLELLNRDGATIVVITHDLDIAGRLPRVISLRDGRIERDDVAQFGAAR